MDPSTKKWMVIAMDIGKKIYELRKLNQVTQEQLAKEVGVSTPTVCKWETGVSMPDISLLAPIARMFHTNVDDLLSFQETVTEEELQDMMNQLVEKAKDNGLDAYAKLGQTYLQQYPRNEELRLRIAMSPLTIAYLYPDKKRKENDAYQKIMMQSIAMLEELAQSKTEQIKITAKGALVGRYMEIGRYEEAEVLLKEIPEKEYGTTYLLPHLYLKKGELKQSLACAQKNMQKDVNGVLIDMRAMHAVLLKSKQYEKALKCAADFLTIENIFGTNVMFGNELLLETYLEMNDLQEAEAYFLAYVDELMNRKLQYDKSFYFSEINLPIEEKWNKNMQGKLYETIMKNGKYKVLRGRKKVEDKLRLFKESL